MVFNNNLINVEQIWPEWKTVEIIGQGGFGVVYKIQNKKTLQYEALKVIEIGDKEKTNDLIMSNQDPVSYYDSMFKKYMREVQIMESLSGDPNIVEITAHKERKKKDGGYIIYIRMEYLKCIKEYFRKRFGSFDLDQETAVMVGLDISSVLKECRKNNVIHRDIKPENVFVDESGNYKLGDFGVARNLGNKSSASTVARTEGYEAPEIKFGQRYDYSVDVYSLGIMLYLFLNGGKFPFVAQNTTTVSEEWEDPNARRYRGEELPLPMNAHDGLGEIVVKACSFKKEDRYTAEGLYDELIRYADLKGYKLNREEVDLADDEAEEDDNSDFIDWDDFSLDDIGQEDNNDSSAYYSGTAEEVTVSGFSTMLSSDDNQSYSEAETVDEPEYTINEDTVIKEAVSHVTFSELNNDIDYSHTIRKKEERILSEDMMQLIYERTRNYNYDMDSIVEIEFMEDPADIRTPLKFDVSEKEDKSIFAVIDNQTNRLIVYPNGSYQITAPADSSHLLRYHIKDVDEETTNTVSQKLFSWINRKALKIAKITEWECSLHGVRTINLRHLNTSCVKNMSGLFRGLGSLTDLDLRAFDTLNTENMSELFFGCGKLNSLDVSRLNTDHVRSMKDMFNGCAAEHLDLSGFRTEHVKNMSGMFEGCTNLHELDLISFDTSDVTDMSRMFKDCIGIGELDLHTFNTSSVTNMAEMFHNCSSLYQLDISLFDTSNVVDYQDMLTELPELKYLDLSSFHRSKKIPEHIQTGLFGDNEERNMMPYFETDPQINDKTLREEYKYQKIYSWSRLDVVPNKDQIKYMKFYGDKHGSLFVYDPTYHDIATRELADRYRPNNQYRGYFVYNDKSIFVPNDDQLKDAVNRVDGWKTVQGLSYMNCEKLMLHMSFDIDAYIKNDN